MSAEAYRGSFVEGLLDQVTAFHGIEHRLGAAEDVREGAPPRIVWVPPTKAGIKISPAPFARTGADTQAWAEAALVVSFWGESYDAAMSLYTDTWVALDSLFGPPQGRPAVDSDLARPGYDLGDPTEITVEERVAGSVLFAAPATLRAFVDRAKWGTAPIVTIPITVATTAPGGTVEETDLQQEITAP